MTPVSTAMPPVPEADESEGRAAYTADEPIQFAPLTLTLDPVEPQPPHDSSIDDLVARVVGAIDTLTAPLDHVATSDSADSADSR